MKLIITILSIILLLSVYSKAEIIIPRDDDPDPTYMQVIPLRTDSTYTYKWEQVFRIPNNKAYLLMFINRLGKYFDDEGIIPDEFKDNIKSYMAKYFLHQPDMGAEMKAISDASGFSLDDIYLINFGLDLFSYQDSCTSIIVRKSNGSIMLARNLDFIFEKYISKISLRFDYYNDKNNLVYSVSQLSGFASMLTGVKYDKFILSLDLRRKGNLEQNFKQFEKGAYEAQYLLKKTLFEADSYEEAVEMLKQSPQVAPSYLIIAGTEGNQGTIIEKDRNQADNIYTLTDDVWFLVATNYDQNVIEGDGRMEFAKNKIQEIGQENIVEEILYQEVMRTFPIWHKITISTAVYNAKYHYAMAYTWY